MKKIINERLSKLSAFIQQEDKIIDIGCDHALLDIYLCLKYPNMHIIASDINSKPLNAALKNVLKYHLENNIELKVGNGLEAMSNDVDTIVISGMGTNNIIHILSNILAFPKVKKLVLSPNNDFSLLRREICKLGFRITKEEMVLEKDKFYLISEFQKGKEDIDEFFGKLKLDDITVKKYFYNLYLKNQKIIDNLSSNSLKKEELMEMNNKIQRIYNF